MDENINLTTDEMVDLPVEDASSNPVYFRVLKGTKSEFKTLTEYSEGALYYCTDTGELFIAQENNSIKEIGRIGKDFAINSNGEIATNGDFSEGHGEIFNDYINNRASGEYSHAEGRYTKASEYASHAEGNSTTASGKSSHAEGYGTEASSPYSHAEGINTIASETASHAEGYKTTASGLHSHAEGNNTEASGSQSHAEGWGTTASANCSHSEGFGTIANSKSQHVQGEYNILDTENTTGRGQYAHIVGNGTSDSDRSNAHTLDWDGNAWYAGNLTVSKEEPTLWLQNENTNSQTYLQLFENTLEMGCRNDIGSEDNQRALLIRNSKGSSPALSQSAALIDIVDGNKTIYNLYGEHNKPTPDDIGAATTSHASSTTLYGEGNNNNYGHVKLYKTSDCNDYTSENAACTPAAAKKAVELFALDGFNKYCWRRRAVSFSTVKGSVYNISSWEDMRDAGGSNGALVYSSSLENNAEYTIQYSSSIAVNDDLSISLVNPSNLTITYNMSLTAVTALVEKYCIADGGAILYIPAGATCIRDRSSNKSKHYISMSKIQHVTSIRTPAEWEFLISTSNTEYPKHGISNGYEYQYFGKIENSMKTGLQFYEGEYWGTAHPKAPVTIISDIYPLVAFITTSKIKAQSSDSEASAIFYRGSNTGIIHNHGYDKTCLANLTFTDNSITWEPGWIYGENEATSTLEPELSLNAGNTLYKYFIIGYGG